MPFPGRSGNPSQKAATLAPLRFPGVHYVLKADASIRTLSNSL